MNPTRILPEGFAQGPLQGRNLVGEVTEAVHRFMLEGWPGPNARPRIEEDLSFVPKDREEVLYVYLYRIGHNTALMNRKRWREARIQVARGEGQATEVYYERPPVYLDLYYLISAHSKFRSDAERLMGWVILRLHEATHLLYRPRRFILPDGREIDSMGRPWRADQIEGGDDLIMEKVSLAMVDDLTIGDAINFFTIHESPFRPYFTYQARCAMEGALLSAPPTTVRAMRAESIEGEPSPERPSGRIGRIDTRPQRKERPVIGPEMHNLRPIEDDDNESED